MIRRIQINWIFTAKGVIAKLITVVCYSGSMETPSFRDFDTTLSNDTPKYGSILDRFLPIRQGVSGISPYKTIPYRGNGKRTNISQSTRMNRPLTELNDQIAFDDSDSYSPLIFRHGFFRGDFDSFNGSQRSHGGRNIDATTISEYHYSSNNSDDDGIGYDDRSDTSVNGKNENLLHESFIAKALGFRKTRVLNFRPLKSQIRRQKSTIEQPSDDLHDNGVSFNKPKVEKDTLIQTEVPFKVLDAPGLRNDFYSNVVCWSKKCDNIAVGLGSVVYTWNETFGTIPLQPLGTDLISSLSYSDEDILAVGTKSGKVYIYHTGSHYISASIELKIGISICSIRWVPGSMRFFTGDDTGEVTLFEVLQVENDGFQLMNCVTFRCDQQQICGMDVNAASDQLVIGANNNNSSIWDIKDLLRPKRMFHLPHDAAVKAVAFCPWMPNLLATGGGSRDRNLRFWHTTSGTLISKFETKGQITSIVWSHSQKEILVTFGFGNVNDRNGIISVYSYPSMKLKVKIDAPTDLRVLSSDISNDSRSICTAISDQSVRIYTIWESKYDLKNSNYDNGIFGSGIIDLEEGVDSTIHTIR